MQNEALATPRRKHKLELAMRARKHILGFGHSIRVHPSGRLLDPIHLSGMVQAFEVATDRESDVGSVAIFDGWNLDRLRPVVPSGQFVEKPKAHTRRAACVVRRACPSRGAALARLSSRASLGKTCVARRRSPSLPPLSLACVNTPKQVWR